jgi:hypothetical protein
MEMRSAFVVLWTPRAVMATAPQANVGEPTGVSRRVTAFTRRLTPVGSPPSSFIFLPKLFW